MKLITCSIGLDHEYVSISLGCQERKGVSLKAKSYRFVLLYKLFVTMYIKLRDNYIALACFSDEKRKKKISDTGGQCHLPKCTHIFCSLATLLDH